MLADPFPCISFPSLKNQIWKQKNFFSPPNFVFHKYFLFNTNCIFVQRKASNFWFLLIAKSWNFSSIKNLRESILSQWRCVKDFSSGVNCLLGLIEEKLASAWLVLYLVLWLFLLTFLLYLVPWTEIQQASSAFTVFTFSRVFNWKNANQRKWRKSFREGSNECIF